MLHSSAEPIVRSTQDRTRRSLVERVREKIASLGCDRVWARGAGSQVLLGLRGQDAYARLTPVRDSLFGLAFRAQSDAAVAAPTPSDAAQSEAASAWHPLLLVDALEDVVEHALIAVDAVSVQA
jgi:hypothetical protein